MVRLIFKVFLFSIICLNNCLAQGSSIHDQKYIGDSLSDSIQVMSLIEKSKKSTGLDYKALEVAFQAKELAYKYKNDNLKLESTLNIAKLFFYLGLYSESLENTLKAIEIAGNNQDDYLGLGKAYFQLGSLRLVMEDYSKALEYIELSKSYYLKFYGNEDQIDLPSVSLRGIRQD
jgi:tetratricopeptide (TPR) repeat protein